MIHGEEPPADHKSYHGRLIAIIVSAVAMHSLAVLFLVIIK